MADFNRLKIALYEQMSRMAGSGALFQVDVGKDELWDKYMQGFRPEANPIYIERTEHDCQCCRQFIRACGNVVALIDNKLVSIWDITDVGEDYQPVVDGLSEMVHAQGIRDIFLHYTENLGTDHNHQLLENGKTKTWEHFHFELPSQFVKREQDIGTELSKARSCKDVFKRGLIEISVDAAETILELIESNSVYRGEEKRGVVELFIQYKKAFDKIPPGYQDNYCWDNSVRLGDVARLRNTSIGTMLVDVTEGMPLDTAVFKFNNMMDPTNYKRPTAVITKGMIAKAQKKVAELGVEEIQHRRFAVPEDITVANVLWADRAAKKAMNAFDEMAGEVPVSIGDLKKVDEMDIKTFIETVLPKADTLELMVENRHQGNLMSLIAPINLDAALMFKWGNNFSWTYKAEVADSIKERVKKAGGSVTGVLRYSIQWNDGDNNQNDFDAHCVEPDKNLIYFPKKTRVQPSSGVLDVDIQHPGKAVAVENITWSDINRMQEGPYKMLVHNFQHNGGKTGFTAEIEYDGVIHSYSYTKELRQNELVTVAELDFSREKGIKFLSSLPSTQASKEVWGVPTQQFCKVSMVMNSPNHWDGEKTGNRHWFFILDGCNNDQPARGFFNEFLKEDLREHRKVLEVLGSKTKTAVTDTQLSGVGFSSTQKNHIFCKVTGSFTRTLKITF